MRGGGRIEARTLLIKRCGAAREDCLPPTPWEAPHAVIRDQGDENWLRLRPPTPALAPTPAPAPTTTTAPASVSTSAPIYYGKHLKN